MQSHVVATANGSCNVQKLQLQQQQQQHLQYEYTHIHSEVKEIMLAITFTCMDECVALCVYVCVSEPNLYTNSKQTVTASRGQIFIST